MMRIVRMKDTIKKIGDFKTGDTFEVGGRLYMKTNGQELGYGTNAVSFDGRHNSFTTQDLTPVTLEVHEV